MSRPSFLLATRAVLATLVVSMTPAVLLAENPDEFRGLRVMVLAGDPTDDRRVLQARQLHDAMVHAFVEEKTEASIDLVPAASGTWVRSHEQAIELRVPHRLDAVVWIDDDEQAFLSLLRALDPRDHDGPIEWNGPGHFALHSLDRMPCDAATRLGPWGRTPKATQRLIDALDGLADLATGRFGAAEPKLARARAFAPDLAFYHAIALLRQRKHAEAASIFGRIADDEPQHLGARLGQIACHLTDIPAFYADRTRKLIGDAARVAPADARVNALFFADVLSKRGATRDLVEQHLLRICGDPQAERMSEATRWTILYLATFLEVKHFRGNRLQGPLGCPAFKALQDNESYRSLLCLITAQSGFELPTCTDWNPDPEHLGPIHQAFRLTTGSSKKDVQEILALAEGDPDLGSTVGEWGFAAARRKSPEPILEWIDEHLDPAAETDLSRLGRGLLLLSVDRGATAAEVLAGAEFESTSLNEDLKRYLAIALILADQPDRALEVLESGDTYGRSLAMLGQGRLAEAYRELRRGGHAADARVMEVAAASLTREDGLVDRIAESLIRDLRSTIVDAPLFWRYGGEIEKISWHLDPVALPGTRLALQEHLGLDYTWALPRRPEELAKIVRKESPTAAERLVAVAETFLEDREQDVEPLDVVPMRALDPRWRRMVAAGHTDEAAARLERTVAQPSSRKHRQQQLAAFELLRGNAKRAVAMIDAEDDDPVSLKLRVVALTVLEAPEAARQALERLRRAAPDDPEMPFLTSMVLSAEERIEEAVQVMEASTRETPDDPHAWVWLARPHLGPEKDCAAAVEPLKHAVTVFSGYGVARRWLGHCYDQLGRLPEAEGQLRADLEIDPDRRWTNRRLVDVLEKQERYGEAVARLKTMLEYDQEDARAWRDLAYNLSVLGAYDEAEIAFRQAIDQEDGAWTRSNLGHALRMQGKLDEAAREFETSIEMDATSSWTLRQLGWTRFEQQRFDEAEKALRDAVSLGPEHRWTRHDLASFLGYRGRTEESRDFLIETLERDPEAATSVGMWLRVFGFAEEARRVLKQAVAEQGDDVEARLNLGRIYREEGRTEEVRELLDPVRNTLAAKRTEGSFDKSEAHQLAYALALTDRITECREAIQQVVDRFAEMLGDDLYELGCIAALNGDRDRAVDLLERAVDAGYRDFDWLRRDPDLAGLARDPRLEALLRRQAGSTSPR